jgi:hypothetical protein
MRGNLKPNSARVEAALLRYPHAASVVIKISQNIQRNAIDPVPSSHSSPPTMRRPPLKKPVPSKTSSKTTRKPTRQGSVTAKTTVKAAVPVAEAPASKRISTSSKKMLKPKKICKEEFSFSVTQAFRKQFKQAAKEAGHKKSEFLQILLLHWEEGQKKPPSGASL